ncbi:nicotinamide riboside kinase 2-like isoform X1 [Synchiropus splendidus]|uniref:nicotinamide riboside kinase 2-like isoform X1 n=1 Tax=Synchiropus splendidus TaxID=270530 RepID=UPI00237D5696|nr:nicotinamide riboside kinase 2-like isoform X1 [Synchiropus splendidus]
MSDQQAKRHGKKNYIIGIGGVTNGGKTTLAKRLKKTLPNCCVVHQDDYYKKPDEIEVGPDGFKQWDVITALDMEAMTNTIKRWISDPVKFGRSQGITYSPGFRKFKNVQPFHILIVDGFLIYNYPGLTDLFDKRYYISITYEECKIRRSFRQYIVADPPGLFDGHVWPMYLKHRKSLEESNLEIEHLDGMKPKEDLYNQVFEDIQNKLLNQL